MDGLGAGPLEALPPEILADARGLRSLGTGLSAAEALFFHDHGALLESLGGVLASAGLREALVAMARYQQEDRDHWLRRLDLLAREARLRAQRDTLDQDYRALLEGHFRRWGAAGLAGERASAQQAALVWAAYREAERQWVAGNGRPVLPVLVDEALVLLWPALYPHLRRG